MDILNVFSSSLEIIIKLMYLIKNSGTEEVFQTNNKILKYINYKK